MGIGMVVFVDARDEAPVIAHLRARGEDVLRIGTTDTARGSEGEVRWADE